MKTRRNTNSLAGLFVLAVTFVLSAVLLQAQESTPSPEDREETQRAAVLQIIDDAFIPGDFDTLDNYLAETYVVHSPFGDLDREATKGFLGAVRSALSDFAATREPVVVEDELVATRTVLSGTFSSAFASPWGVIEPNQQPITFAFINIFRFDEQGMIAEEWVQFDNYGLLSQMGALPSA